MIIRPLPLTHWLSGKWPKNGELGGTGCPFYLKHVDGKLSRKQLIDLAGDIMEHIAELLPLWYQEYYTGRVDSNEAED